MTNNYTLIIGANSSIAKAIAHEVDTNLILISRNFTCYSTDERSNIKKLIHHIRVDDYQENTIEQAIGKIKAENILPITQVFICNGILHAENIQPEKRLEDFKPVAFNRIMEINALIPLLWIQHLTPLLKSKLTCKLVVFSARVGSISDNKLGGWYSYRASKAALNMMLKTAAVELARRAKNIKIVAFHPGTTDTSLSKPFQKNVASSKLFTTQFVAKQLLSVLHNIKADQTASYIDWEGKKVDW